MSELGRDVEKRWIEVRTHIEHLRSGLGGICSVLDLLIDSKVDEKEKTPLGRQLEVLHIVFNLLWTQKKNLEDIIVTIERDNAPMVTRNMKDVAEDLERLQRLSQCR